MNVELRDEKYGDRTEHNICWMYPSDGSALLIDICHVRVIDEVRVEFDFTNHQWVAKQERQACGEHSSEGTGEWIEVARWSGNAPGVDKP